MTHVFIMRGPLTRGLLKSHMKALLVWRVNRVANSEQRGSASVSRPWAGGTWKGISFWLWCYVFVLCTDFPLHTFGLMFFARGSPLRAEGVGFGQPALRWGCLKGDPVTRSLRPQSSLQALVFHIGDSKNTVRGYCSDIARFEESLNN